VPALIDTKHEAFARYVAAGLSQTAAATKAGFPENSAHNTGSRLAKRPEIQERVDELKALSAEGSGVSRQWVINEAIEIKRAAIAADDYSSAIRAVEFIARVSGHLNERKESPSRVGNLNLLDTGQILQILRAQWDEFTTDDREELLLASPELSDAIEVAQQTNGAYGKPVDVGDCNPKSKGKKAEPE
jgi:hypothetical protein